MDWEDSYFRSESSQAFSSETHEQFMDNLEEVTAIKRPGASVWNCPTVLLTERPMRTLPTKDRQLRLAKCVFLIVKSRIEKFSGLTPDSSCGVHWRVGSHWRVTLASFLNVLGEFLHSCYPDDFPFSSYSSVSKTEVAQGDALRRELVQQSQCNFVEFIVALLLDLAKSLMKKYTSLLPFDWGELVNHGDEYIKGMKPTADELILVARFLSVALSAKTNFQSSRITAPLPPWAKLTCPRRYTKREPIFSPGGPSTEDTGRDPTLKCSQCRKVSLTRKKIFALPSSYVCGALHGERYAYIKVLWEYFGVSCEIKGYYLLAGFLTSLSRELDVELLHLNMEVCEALIQLIYEGLQFLDEETLILLFPACFNVLKAVHYLCVATRVIIVRSDWLTVVTSTLRSLESILKACNVIPVECVESLALKVKSVLSERLEAKLLL